MTPAELLALANRLLYGCRDPVTGERLSAGLPAEAIVEDVEEAARRQQHEAEMREYSAQSNARRAAREDARLGGDE